MADEIAGVLLAGGLSRRMGGGDKCLRPIGGRTILEHIVERVRPQVARLVLNANGDPSRFDAFGLPVVGDTVDAAPCARLRLARKLSDRLALPAAGFGETSG
jgi:molybdopterin-guanine dinucleotide biosynthesis protein A